MMYELGNPIENLITREANQIRRFATPKMKDIGKPSSKNILMTVKYIARRRMAEA
jgi:hypothetical protein